MAMFIDLRNAFFSVIRQVGLDLPFAGDDLEAILSKAELPEQLRPPLQVIAGCPAGASDPQLHL